MSKGGEKGRRRGKKGDRRTGEWRRRGRKTGGAEESRGLEEEGGGEQEGEVSRRG